MKILNQKRRRMKSHSKRSNKNIHESSSKSFRIKDKSAASLPREGKDGLGRNKDNTINNLVTRLMEERGNRQRKAKSVQKTRQFQMSKTIQNRASKIPKTPSNNNFFNEMSLKIRPKNEKQRPNRRKMYETINEQRAKSQQAGDIQLYKISSTNAARPAQEDEPKKKKKGNFRRNKYEALTSSAAATREIEKFSNKQCIQSDSRIELDKKDSNVSINREMDRLNKRQNDVFYRQRRAQIHSSVQKSTEKYFNHESYRPIKSKNDIEVFMSTVKNPSVHKVSKSTLDDKAKSSLDDKAKSRESAFPLTIQNQPQESKLLEYEFDFGGEDEGQLGRAGISEMDNPSEEEGSMALQECQGEFQKMRRRVEVADFNKGGVELQWSQDDCMVCEL